MRERPILFSGPMVRAILDGTKTQTRRVVKPQPFEGCGRIVCGTYHPCVVDRHGEEQPGEPTFGAYGEAGEWGARCPYGQPGDRLWVRETWAVNPYTPEVRYRATDELWTDAGPLCWRPSIHMPKDCCRIRLDIVGVRAERLNDISEADARAEGVMIEDKHKRGYCCGEFLPPSIRAYRELWEQINGVVAWAKNPWVWVVEFKRCS